MGSSDVKGERMGLSPLAVEELAKEFRRLAETEPETSDHWQDPAYYSGLSDGWTLAMEQAAQMLEEKLNG